MEKQDREGEGRKGEWLNAEDWPITQRDRRWAGLKCGVSASESSTEGPCPHVGVEFHTTMSEL